MEIKNLRELLIQMEAQVGSAWNKEATIGQVLTLVHAIAKEIEELKTTK